MKRRWFLWMLIVGLCAAHGWAQNNFLYTNNDTIPNTVTGFAVGEDGTLTEVPGSPFLTGGNGSAPGDFLLFASNRIRVVGSFLYTSNSRSGNISGFVIDLDTGTLTPVPGSPFLTGGLFGNISLAASPNGQFLYAGSDSSQNMAVFGIGPDGELTAVGSPVPTGDGLDGMVVSPDGKWLTVVLLYEGPHGSVAMFRVDPKTGEITPVKGSPFRVRGPGGPDARAAGVDVNCAGDAVFIGEATFSTTIVDVLSIDPDTGVLAPVEGSPFMPGVGVNSNVPVVSPGDALLFVSNQGTGSPGSGETVTVFAIADDRTLTLVPGSPFPTGVGQPAGMTTDQGGVFLYVAAQPNLVAGLNIDAESMLLPVPGSPFSTAQPTALLSLAAHPAKTCPLKRGSQQTSIPSRSVP